MSLRNASGERTSILILGGGVMQLPAIRIASERGWRVTVADGNARVPGAALADLFLKVDLKDVGGMERAARKLARSAGLDGVFTAGTDFSATVAWVAERLGLPGIPYEVALRATDKSLMRAAFRAAKVPSPEFVMVESVADCAGAVSDAGLRLPVVVKPVDNMGSRGIRRVDSLAELEAATKRAIKFSRSGRAIVEEFVPGPEFSLDAIVEGGAITVTGLADRIIGCAPYFVELGHTIPSVFPKRDTDRVRAVFEAGIRALGIGTGAAKGDIKLSPAGPVVGEIAARLSGGYMSGWTYPYAAGVQATAAALNLAVGLAAGDLAPRWAMASAERAFVSIPGRIERLSGVEAVSMRPSVKGCFLRVKPGDEVVFPSNNVEKCGNVLAQAGTRAEAVDSAEEACRSIVVRLRPGERATADFLFGAPSATAFSIEAGGKGARAELARSLAAMPLFVAPSEGRRGGKGEERQESETRVAILPLDGMRGITALDWQGRSVEEALEAVLEAVDAPLLPVSGRPAAGTLLLGKLFWRAFLRGGVQGGIWLVETVRERLSGPEGAAGVKLLLEEWGVTG